VLVLFVLLFRMVRPGDILAAFHEADPFLLTLAAALMIPNLALQVLKWHFILRVVEPRPPLSATLESVFGGFFLGAASPGRTGEIARGVFFPGHSMLRIASLTLVDKGFNQLTVIVLGLFSLAFLLPWPFSLIPVAADVLIIAAVLGIHRLRPFLEKLLHRFVHSETIDNALAAFDALSPGTVVGMLCYSVAFYSVYVLQFYVMTVAFTDLTVIVAVKTLPVMYLINLVLPVSFGGFGVKETAAVYLLGPFGMSGGAVFGAALLNNVLTFLLPSLAGGVVTALFSPERRSKDHS